VDRQAYEDTLVGGEGLSDILENFQKSPLSVFILQAKNALQNGVAEENDRWATDLLSFKFAYFPCR